MTPCCTLLTLKRNIVFICYNTQEMRCHTVQMVLLTPGKMSNYKKVTITIMDLLHASC